MDQTGVFGLVESVYAEYGYVASREHCEADLVDLNANFFNQGGCFWVAEADSKTVGCHGYLPLKSQPGICTFRRLYVSKPYRGTDIGKHLMQTTIDWARGQGMQRVVFWSDTKFTRAHRFFNKFGFIQTDKKRELHDGLQPYQEWFCYLDL